MESDCVRSTSDKGQYNILKFREVCSLLDLIFLVILYVFMLLLNIVFRLVLLNHTKSQRAQKIDKEVFQYKVSCIFTGISLIS